LCLRCVPSGLRRTSFLCRPTSGRRCSTSCRCRSSSCYRRSTPKGLLTVGYRVGIRRASSQLRTLTAREYVWQEHTRSDQRATRALIGPMQTRSLPASRGNGLASRLVPKQHSTGGKDRLGNRYLRWLLVVDAMAVIRYARKHGTEKRPWLGRLMKRRPAKGAAVALANKRLRGWPGPSWSGARDTRSRSCRWRREAVQQVDRQRGHDDVMQIRSFRGSREPAWVNAPLLKCVVLFGTRSAQSIRASSYTCRTNRPDT
jgi:hypothetical protein